MVLVCLVIVSGVRLSNEIARRMAIASQIHALRDQVDKLRGERDSLSYLMTTLSSDAYIEDAARKKLNMAKTGEKVVVIPEEKPAATNVAHAPEQSSNIDLWWNYFFEVHAN